jgi:hypothetical protein
MLNFARIVLSAYVEGVQAARHSVRYETRGSHSYCCHVQFNEIH